MALAPLADVTDLPEAWDTHADAARALDVASAAIRDAAGSTISQATSTVTVPAPLGPLLRLPGPVVSVAEVTVDGAVVTDHVVMAEGLWLRGGWACGPAPVTITYTHGLAVVPPDVRDLACQLAVSWLQHAEAGGGSTAGLTMVAIDDARESYTDEAAGAVSPVHIPKLTRDWLAARFGQGGVTVLEAL